MTGTDLWARVEDYARRTAHYFFRGAHDADDAYQDYAMLCLGFPAKYPDSPDTALILMAKRAMWNQTLDKCRRNTVKNRVAFALYQQDPGSVENPLEEAECNEMFARIHEELSDADRGVYFLQAWGYSRAEICKRKGVSDGIVWRSRLRLAEVAKRYGIVPPAGYSA
jgi:DNA-directed RNA polymerase specialized sigma24 family protein